MGFFGKLFGSKVSVESLQRAVEQQRFADAVYLGEELHTQPLGEDVITQVERLRAEAGDGLARLNLIEAKAKQEIGEYQEATTCFDMAWHYAHSEQLKEEIRQARQVPFEISSPTELPSTAGCSSCNGVDSNQRDAAGVADVDDAIRFDLILTSYPDGQRERYQERGKDFIAAFLLAHEGENEQACELFHSVEASARDDLYWFELGSLQARMGNLVAARESLEKALQCHPDLQLALEALVEVLLLQGQGDAALTLVERKLHGQHEDPSRLHALLVTIHGYRQDWPAASVHVRYCLQGHYNEPGFIALAAVVMEKIGALDEAEGLLKRLPSGGGCKGATISLPLAEFYLRHQRELEKIFSSFNAALKQNPEDPRWRLRLAQTCFARQWYKDGLQLLQQLGDASELSAELAAEARWLQEQYANTTASPP